MSQLHPLMPIRMDYKERTVATIGKILATFPVRAHIL